ncbi:MAG: GTP-dependent dephospho-CoA kinase family protein [Candidatus Baldrarchaeia archaeon]
MSEESERLVLPESLRDELKKPIGILIRGKHPKSTIEAVKIIKSFSPNLIVAVGDVVTESLLDVGLVPDVSIVDMKTLRKEYQSPRVCDAIDIKTKNPAGTITLDAWLAIKRAINSGQRIRIFVEGEEDLLTLPAVIHAPLGAVIIYGQPNEGLVVIKVNEDIKKKALDIISRMEGPTHVFRNKGCEGER